MSELNILTVTAADGHDLLTAAQSDWSLPVQDCPGWNAADLVGHMGAILGWIAKIVTSGQAVPRRDRQTPPADRDTLAAWYRAHLNRTLSILTATPPESRAWTFSSGGDQRVSWWRRRLAVELAIHRWDAQHATSLGAKALPAPIDGHVAAAGIEEFLTEFLPGLLSQPDTIGLTGSLHLHATDGTSEWWINLDERSSAVAVPGHRKADTAIRATRSNLLLWLTNRQRPDALEISGPPEVAAQWTQLRRLPTPAATGRCRGRSPLLAVEPGGQGANTAASAGEASTTQASCLVAGWPAVMARSAVTRSVTGLTRTKAYSQPGNAFRPPGSFNFPARVTVTDPAVARKIAVYTCQLPAAHSGPISNNCLNEIGIKYALHFKLINDVMMSMNADPTGCESVWGQGFVTRTTAFSSDFWQVLGTAMGLRQPSQQTFVGTSPKVKIPPSTSEQMAREAFFGPPVSPAKAAYQAMRHRQLAGPG